MKELLSGDAAAEYLGLKRQTLAKLRCTGGSLLFYKVGRRILYDRCDLDEWLDARHRASTSDSGAHAKSLRSRRASSRRPMTRPADVDAGHQPHNRLASIRDCLQRTLDESSHEEAAAVAGELTVQLVRLIILSVKPSGT